MTFSGVSNKLTPIIFADDTNLFISDSKIENLFETMNKELRKVATWFKANELSLNVSKTKCSLFHSTRKMQIDNWSQSFSKYTWMKVFPGSIILIL